MLRKLNLPVASIALVSVLAASAALAATPREQRIIDRIKPVGTVCVQGKDCSGNAAAADAAPAAEAQASAAPAAAAAPAAPRSGEAVYNASCTVCHTAGVSGAPKVGVAADWAPRIAQGEATLLEHAIKGIRAMPPKGTCMTCSDDEIKAAVEYMVSKSH